MNKKMYATTFLAACSMLVMNCQTSFAEETDFSGTITMFATGNTAKGVQAAFEEYQKMHGLWERLSAMQKQYMLQMQTAMSIRYEEAAVCRQVW